VSLKRPNSKYTASRRALLRGLLLLPTAGSLAAFAESPGSGSAGIRGKLHTPTEEEAWLQTEDGRKIRLHGDEQTELVLHDERLKELEFELHGEAKGDDGFEILPIHRPALFAWVNGERLRVTYYCDVCAIRTYSPGMCMCCREDTRVDLVDPAVISR
jgi:hypothetical protein